MASISLVQVSLAIVPLIFCFYLFKKPHKGFKRSSGHEVDASMKIVIFSYALGRMKAIWGHDALEFKPERWVSITRGLIEVPSSKFFSFNAGPRACLGKKLAMILMKTVVVEILQNYDIEVIQGQKIEPAPGPILHMKHGLRVKLTKACTSSST